MQESNCQGPSWQGSYGSWIYTIHLLNLQPLLIMQISRVFLKQIQAKKKVTLEEKVLAQSLLKIMFVDLKFVLCPDIAVNVGHSGV